MNIIDALKSGKRIKRPNHREYWLSKTVGDILITTDAILADDWEIELEPNRTVTRWKWAGKKEKGGDWNESSFFLTEEEAAGVYKNYYQFHKLAYTETVFPE